MMALQPEAAAGSRSMRMHALLTQAFCPSRLEIVDDSAKHAGHSGAAAGGETHFNITVVSDFFTNHSRIERSRMVNEVLASEFATGLHALSVSLRSPTE
jgi:BolA protein